MIRIKVKKEHIIHVYKYSTHLMYMQRSVYPAPLQVLDHLADAGDGVRVHLQLHIHVYAYVLTR